MLDGFIKSIADNPLDDQDSVSGKSVASKTSQELFKRLQAKEIRIDSDDEKPQLVRYDSTEIEFVETEYELADYFYASMLKHLGCDRDLVYKNENDIHADNYAKLKCIIDFLNPIIEKSTLPTEEISLRDNSEIIPENNYGIIVDKTDPNKSFLSPVWMTSSKRANAAIIYTFFREKVITICSYLIISVY